ncbi:MAG: hypothetical protein WA690_02370 [Candidatus Acidiferrales bacterium]
MADVVDLLKEYGAPAVAFLSPASGAVLAFSGLIEVPLDLRLILIGMFDLATAACVVLALTPTLVRNIKGFNRQPAKPRFFRPAVVGKILLILVTCVAAVVLLRITLTYHNILLSQTTNAEDARVGTIELVPSHFSTNVTIILSTPQPNVRILDLKLQGCGTDPINTPNIQDPTDFSATIHLYGFKTPQKFCAPYRLSDAADRLTAAVTTTVSNIEVLRDDRMRMYQKHEWFFGGVLCVLALVYFSYRYS